MRWISCNTLHLHTDNGEAPTKKNGAQIWTSTHRI